MHRLKCFCLCIYRLTTLCIYCFQIGASTWGSDEGVDTDSRAASIRQPIEGSTGRGTPSSTQLARVCSRTTAGAGMAIPVWTIISGSATAALAALSATSTTTAADAATADADPIATSRNAASFVLWWQQSCSLWTLGQWAVAFFFLRWWKWFYWGSSRIVYRLSKIRMGPRRWDGEEP